MKTKPLTLRILFFCTLLLTGVSQANARNKPTVYTVNYPLYYFAQRIGGEYIDLYFPAPTNVDPAFWTPDEATMKKYQLADLIILNGADYAKWTKKVSLPMLRTVDTSKAFKNDLIHIKTNVTHSHGPGGDHSREGTAFTTWLDFSQAVLQAEAIYRALARKIPAHQAELVANFKLLEKDLLTLDEQMLDFGKQIPDRPLLASHPIYQYMARRYALNIKMLMWEPDIYPGSQEWEPLQELIKNHPASWIIWEGEPVDASVSRLAEMNVSGNVFSPCFSRPGKGDFLSVMQRNINNLTAILKQ